MKNLWKKKWFWGGVLAIILGLWYFWPKFFGIGGSTVNYVTAKIQKGTVSATVSGSGQIQASDQLDIKPQTDGRITSLPVKINQEIKNGDTIAIIDQQTAANSLAQAKAQYEQAQANYDKLMAGATQNDIASSQLSVESAQNNLDKAKRDYDSTVSSQQQSVDKALSSLLNSGLTLNPSDTLTTASVTLSGNYTGTDQGNYNVSLYQGSGGLYYAVTGLGNINGLITRGLDIPLGNGLYINFSASGYLSPSTTWTVQVPNAKGGSYINNLQAYNSALQSQKDALNNAQDSIDSAQLQLSQTQLSYSTKTSPPTASDMASAKAQITSARSQLANAQTAYENTILKAPFNGVIAALNFELGDKVTAGTAIATVITHQQVAKITLNEVDAAKVKVGQKATMTFSAIDGLEMTGTVAQVDTLGTVSQNVVNYNIKIVLDTQNDQIKPGMSVSATIITDTKQDVLNVPSAAVKSSNGQSYVQIMNNGKPQQVQVTVGLEGESATEISGDIKEGDEVVTQTNSSSSKSSNSSSSSQRSSSVMIPGLGGGGFR